MKIQNTPELGVNDMYGTIVSIKKIDNTSVASSELVLEIETSKTIIEVNSLHSGILRHRLKVGDRVQAGKPLFAVTDGECQFDPESIYNVESTEEQKSGQQTITAKARLYADKHNVDLSLLSSLKTIKLADVENIVNVKNTNAEIVNDIVFDKNSQHRPRVLIIGAGRGSAQVLDILIRDNTVRVVGLVDDDVQLSGKSVMGFPVLGTTKDVEFLFTSKVFDCAIISISTNLVLRRNLFHRFTGMGIGFVNAIDPNVVIHSNVKIGTGNIIIAGSRIGTCTEIKDNNFFSAFANIEHHNFVGSHNTFGPTVVFSSRVIVEDSCRFGTGIFVEPGVKIGSSCVVSSGSVLRSNLETRSIVKTKYMQQITISNENKNEQ